MLLTPHSLLSVLLFPVRSVKAVAEEHETVDYRFESKELGDVAGPA